MGSHENATDAGRRVSVLLLAMSAFACRIPEVPIQLLRITQVETYQHRYELEDPVPFIEAMLGPCNMAVLYKAQVRNCPLKAPCSAQKAYGGFVQRMNSAGVNIAGCELKRGSPEPTDDPTLSMDVSELAKDLLVSGALTLVLTPNPYDLHQFAVEGQGRYVVHRDKNDHGRLIASAQFEVTDDVMHSVEELERNLWIDISIRQWPVLELLREQYSFANATCVRARVNLRSPAPYVYEVDYGAWHPISDCADRKKHLGALKFDRPNGGIAKFLDLRMLTHSSIPFASDYRELKDHDWRRPTPSPDHPPTDER